MNLLMCLRVAVASVLRRLILRMRCVCFVLRSKQRKLPAGVPGQVHVGAACVCPRNLPHVVEDVDVTTLDAGHVRPNPMHPPSERGVWFPKFGFFT